MLFAAPTASIDTSPGSFSVMSSLPLPLLPPRLSEHIQDILMTSSRHNQRQPAPETDIKATAT
jgi:hypothetical protein